jgi:hypothetical protein
MEVLRKLGGIVEGTRWGGMRNVVRNEKSTISGWENTVSLVRG